ncbi:nucleoside deaminase [Candidatus Dependentiae bacterium]|nr:nucleoside deaminase [Candidatus Dependentiae bacterium]
MECKFSDKQHAIFMQEALTQAQKSLKQDEVPIGAVVVDVRGNIIGRGHNQVMAKCSQSAHAEILAIEQAGKVQGDWRLEECWLYVTLEPCAMCMNLIILSRLEGVVFGAPSPLFGYSNQNQLDNDDGLPLYKRDALSAIVCIQSEKSVELLKQFFKQKRKSSGSTQGPGEDKRSTSYT